MKVMRKKDRIALFEQLWSEVFNPAYCKHIRELLDERGFFDAPASTKYHGNYNNGYHMETVYKPERIKKIDY